MYVHACAYIIFNEYAGQPLAGVLEQNVRNGEVC